MLPCPGCHRHVRDHESSCPFCGVATLALTAAPLSAKSSLVAFAAGITLLACSESGDDSADDNSVTTNASETMATMGDGDGDTQDPDYSGSDYGGPPPCDELDTAIPLSVGANAVDTTNGPDGFTTTCGMAMGSGPDQVFVFNAPAAGDFSFALTANFDAWLIQIGNYYCYTYGQCVADVSFDISLAEGQVLHLLMDGTAGGAGSIDVTQN